MPGWGVAPLAAIAFALSPGVAGANTCPSAIGGDAAIERVDVAERYRFIEAQLASARRKGRIWNHAWGWGLAGAAVGQVGLGLLATEDDCPRCWYASAGKATLGVISTAVLNPVRIAAVPRADAAPTCEQLAAAEAALTASAKSERVHWMRHVEGVAVNLAATLYMGFELDAWDKGALTFATGLLVGELRLYTRPETATRALRRYRAGAIAAPAEHEITWIVLPTFGRDAYGLSLAIGF